MDFSINVCMETIRRQFFKEPTIYFGRFLILIAAIWVETIVSFTIINVNQLMLPECSKHSN